MQLLPIAPRFATWADRETWLAETRAQRAAFATVLGTEQLADIVVAGKESLADYDADERERRTLLCVGYLAAPGSHATCQPISDRDREAS